MCQADITFQRIKQDPLIKASIQTCLYHNFLCFKRDQTNFLKADFILNKKYLPKILVKAQKESH